MGTEVSEQASCVDGKSFDTVTRRCVVSAFKPAPPEIKQFNIVIDEDSIREKIEIPYVDKNQDIAKICEVVDYGSILSDEPPTCECVAGSCFAYLSSNQNINGETYVSFILTDKDGKSRESVSRVKINPVNDPPEVIRISAGVTTNLTYSNDPNNKYYFKFVSGDIDNEPVTGCEIVAQSDNLIIGESSSSSSGGCVCTVDDISNESECSVQINVPKNVDSLDEFISYRVFSIGDFSEVITTRFSIIDTDDPPLLCLYSRGAEFEECGSEGCVGSGKPDTRYLVPLSHTNEKPVIYFDQTNGDCYHSTNESSFSLSVNGAPSLEFGYIHVEIDEDSKINAFSLRPGIDIDSVVNATTSKYTLKINEDNYLNGMIFSDDCAQVIDSTTEDDLDCAINAPANHENDDYLYRVVILNNTDNNPSLVFREREINKMENKGITIQSGATGGAAVVSLVDDNIFITIEDRVTTAQTIKEAIENNSAISALVKVNLFGSKKEDVLNDNGDSWPKKFELKNLDDSASNIKNDAKHFGYFSYTMSVNETVSNSVPVFVSVSPKNDKPEASGINLGVIGTEEDVIEFSIPIAKDDKDFHNEDLSYIITKINSYVVDGKKLPVGSISHCANLESSDGPSDLTCLFNPAGNFNGEVKVHYRAIDQYGASSSLREISFNVANVDDPPVLCQYHRFNQAQECGLDGCISEFSPVGRVSPSSHVEGAPVYFYQKGSAYCFKSTGTGVNDWEIDATGHIGDVVVNQEQEVLIDNIAVDEGGPGEEDDQQITITDVQVDIESGPSELLQIQLVKFYDYNPVAGYKEFGPNPLPVELDNNKSFDLNQFKIKITPQASTQGVARITFKIDDGENILTSSFRVTVQNVDVYHEGWKNIQAIGPKTGGSGYCEGIDTATGDSYIGKKLTKSTCEPVGIWRDGDVLESPYVCSYSETKCNGGQKCTGTSVSGVKADEFNAIFSQVTAGGERSCYRARGKLDLGYLTLKSKKAGSVIVVVENTDAASTTVENLKYDDNCANVDFESYKFSGGDIFHYVKLNLRYGATTDEVYEAFEKSDASEILEVINNSPAQVMALNNGIYTLGVRDVYLKRIGGLLFASYEEEMSVEIIDKADDGIGFDSSMISNNFLLRKNINPDPVTTCYASLEKDNTLNKIMIIDLDASEEGVDLGVLTTSKVSLQKSEASYEWDSLQTFCNITQSDEEPLCREELNLGASCAGGEAPLNATISSFLSVNSIDHYNSFYADLDSRRCYRSDLIGSHSRYKEYVATGETTLSWESFRATGGSISGYEIFRKLGGVTSDFNFTNTDKLNSTTPAIDSFDFNDQKPIAILSGGNHTSFVDNYATTRHPPVPGTVYFYEVRPIVEGVQASSMEKHSVVRIFSPPKNFVFVHRWIANQTMCNLMHSESRSNADHRMKKYEEYLKCTYNGPKNDGSDFYDLGHDLLVMQVEAGCPYTRRGCTGDDYEDGDCIGAGDVSEIDAAVGAVYYDREKQKCWRKAGGGWTLLNSTAVHESFIHQKLPPITRYNKDPYYDDFCNTVAEHLNTNTLGVVTINGTLVDRFGSNFSTVKEYFFSEVGSLQSSSLPSRREQIAYSQWDTDTYTHEEIEILEQGLSLNATSRCNSSFASGIEDEFINGDSFSVTAPYTKTATENSLDGFNIRVRSLETGSSITQNCKSRYGVQDHVGNMGELSLDTMTYDFRDYYKFDTYVSPCENGNPSDGCDPMPEGFSWTIDQESNGATFFNLPLGLPFSDSVNVDPDNLNYVEINTSAGITTDQLHDDAITFTDSDYNPNFGVGVEALIVSGGSYKSGRGAGTWSLTLVDDETDQFRDVGFRCVIPLKEKNYFEAQFGKGLKNHP